MLHLARPRYQLKHVLQALGDMAHWPSISDIPRPNARAILRAKELVLAVGPLTAEGSKKIILAPSIKGGVVVTFFLTHDVTVALMNNQTVVFVLGKGWTGQLSATEVTLAEAITRIYTFMNPDCGDGSEDKSGDGSGDK